MGRGRGLFVLVVFVAALAAGVVAAPAAVPGVAWTEFLPALPSPSQTHPNRVGHCKRAKLKCVRVEIQRMRALQERLGCDHKAVFATTYLELTRTARDALIADPGLLQWPKWFFREDALFASVYFRTVRAWEQGRAVPEAWRIAFETAETGEVTGAQDMLLGINAHVQNDMPFVLAQLGLRDRKGQARKPDHDLFNKVLSAGYERVVSEVGEVRLDHGADESARRAGRRRRRAGDRAPVARAGVAQRRAAGERGAATRSGRRWRLTSRPMRRSGQRGSQRRRSPGRGHRATRIAGSSSAAEPRLFRPVGLRTCVRVRFTTRT